MVKILAIFGTRPEAIKMLPVVKEFRKYQDNCVCRVCVTAQHRQMLDQVLDIFDVIPDYDLNIMKDNQKLNYLSGEIFKKLDDVFETEKPDWVLVQGDTTTAMIATMAAFHRKIKVGHIEAGLRTWDLNQPYPEEANRKIADMLSTAHFAPTILSKQNLLKENIEESSIFVTGNTVIDALYDILARKLENSTIINTIGLDPNKKLILVTMHRRESFGKPMMEACAAIKRIAKQYSSDIEIVIPVHPNPNVRKIVLPIFYKVKNVKILQPLDYLSLVYLMNKSYFILTDSGGIQEEAPGLGKPVLVLRDVTERPEGIEAGVVKIVGTSFKRIVEEASLLLNNSAEYFKMARADNPYGDGKSSQRIVNIILESAGKIEISSVGNLSSQIKIDNEKISIVMPTYNGLRHIRQSIESCLNQTYKNIELIVVDDGSVEDIKSVIDTYNDNRIKYIRHGKNLGLPKALNTGFSATTGGYLTWTSDDNYYAPEALETMACYLKENNKIDFVYTDFYILNEEGKIIQKGVVPDPEVLKEYYCVGYCFLYTRKVYETIGKYDSKYFLSEDYDYFLRIYNNFKMAKISQAVYYYRVHNNSLSEKYGACMVDVVTNEVKRKNLLTNRYLESSLKGKIYATAIKHYSFVGNFTEARKYILPALLNNPIFCLKDKDRETISAMFNVVFGKSIMTKIRHLKQNILSSILHIAKQ